MVIYPYICFLIIIKVLALSLVSKYRELKSSVSDYEMPIPSDFMWESLPVYV